MPLSRFSCRTASRQRLIYEVNLLVYTERHAALHYITAWRRYYKPVQWLLRHDAAPQNMTRRCKLIDGSYATGNEVKLS